MSVRDRVTRQYWKDCFERGSHAVHHSSMEEYVEDKINSMTLMDFLLAVSAAVDEEISERLSAERYD